MGIWIIKPEPLNARRFNKAWTDKYSTADQNLLKGRSMLSKEGTSTSVKTMAPVEPYIHIAKVEQFINVWRN
jgi:hypothetical protein